MQSATSFQHKPRRDYYKAVHISKYESLLPYLAAEYYNCMLLSFIRSRRSRSNSASKDLSRPLAGQPTGDVT
jgi:hypothetical protein